VRITKSGDAYLRSLLIMGARAVLNAAKYKTDSFSRWTVALEQRAGCWKAVVAIAAKNARMACAMLRRGEQFAMPVRGRRPPSDNQGEPRSQNPPPRDDRR